MKKTFTFNDLILLAYNETDEKSTEQLLDALIENEELLEMYLSVTDMQSKLDEITEEPSESICNNIINYSKALDVFILNPDVNIAFVVNN
ncbi:MAG: hypothetical protein HGB12_09265 [Bacteroidetes bacterium]|nr:hypothetical protein [Bacteroidota bacterium]